MTVTTDDRDIAPTAPQDRDDYRLLIEQVIAGNGLAGVVRLLSDLLALPAAMGDEELEPLHAFAPRGRHLTIEEAKLPPELHGRVEFDVSANPTASTAPPARHLHDGGGQGVCIAPIVLNSGVVGYVWASDPSGHLSTRAEEMVSHAAAACAIEVVRQRAIMEGESRVRNSFLEDLLSGAVLSASSTRRRARYLGYDLRGDHLVFSLDMDRFAEYVARHTLDESAIQRIKERFRRSADTSVSRFWTRSLIWEHSDSLVVLVPAKSYTPAAYAERVELVRGAVEQRLAGPTVSAGIGRPRGDLMKLRQSYHEAEHAVRIGTSVAGPSSTTSFEDLGAYRLLFPLRDQPELEEFFEETLGPLERYDQEQGGHLLVTLDAFLEHHGNLSQTARALHLHRNGLLYRLGRIERISGRDLNDPDQRLALQLALRARPLLRDSQSRPRRIG